MRAARPDDSRPVLTQPKRVALLVYLALAPPAGLHAPDRLLARRLDPLSLFFARRYEESRRAYVRLMRDHPGEWPQEASQWLRCGNPRAHRACAAEPDDDVALCPA